MKTLLLLSLTWMFSAVASGGEALAVLDGAASQATHLEAAKARPYKGGFALDGEEAVCTVTTNAERICGAGWFLTLKQTEPAAVRISVEGKVESGAGSGEALLYIDVSYMDGDHLWGQKSAFPSVAGDWLKRSVMLIPPKPIKSLGIYVMAKKDEALRARFRPPSVETFDAEGGPVVFDGVPVVAEEGVGKPGFLLRDVRAGSGFEKVAGAAKGTRIESMCEKKGRARFFDVTLSDEQGGDRALTLVWALPLGGKKLTWFDSPRSQRDVTDAKVDFRDLVPAPCGAGGHSRWPFLAAAVDGKGVAIGFDPRRPAFSRVSLHAGLRLLYAAFDVALVPEKKLARIGFVVFPFEAKDGFRGALEAYQGLFPELNEVKQTKQGNWMAFRKISKVQGWEDFGFAIKEGDNEIAWDDEHGITTYHYTEPSTWWMSIKGKDGRGQATMEECVAEAERLAATGNKYALAWKTCAMKDEFGRPYGHVKNEPWCNGIVWNLNCAPGQGSDGEFAAKLGDDYFAKSYHGEFPEGLDGEYVDSSEMYVTEPADFSRANFAGMDTPLTFSAGELKPCVFKGMMAYEYVRGVWRKARAVGRRTMANSTPHKWWWLAPHLDVLGTETNWGRNGKWSPLSDADLMYMRAVSGAKPFCFLMNTDFGSFTYEMVEKYMQRALAYGMYPSFFSANASSNHYFDNPTLYNRDRPLFKKYMPLCIRVGEAGWRPVNRLLASDSPDVVTEQFGDRYATVYNLSEKPVRVTLTALSGATEAEELVGGGKWAFENSCRTVDIPGETVFALSFPAN
ncbi:MAG: hypothetical protein IKQ17_09550 [Kiritimatiellae bacterium]|nr:hypothetical protein [Kiritimatiellia bacterium]